MVTLCDEDRAVKRVRCRELAAASAKRFATCVRWRTDSAGGKAHNAVSYTHLDVYKRQVVDLVAKKRVGSHLVRARSVAHVGSGTYHGVDPLPAISLPLFVFHVHLHSIC